MKKKYIQNALFQAGENFRLRACVGDNGGPYDFRDYSEGFFQAGFYTIDAINRGEWTKDLLIYPIVFNFRHGIELYVKHLLILANRYFSADFQMKKTHSLFDNWDGLAKLLKKFPHGTINQSDIKNVRNIISDFIEIDPSGQVFRYPEDLKQNRHLTQIGVINVGILDDYMKVLFDTFETWDSILIYLLESNKVYFKSVKY